MAFVDRGDLSREIRISMIPGILGQIINRCKETQVPWFVATNVLDSMLDNKLPSRAEISDIYNLLSAGISGFVLAAEVAIGENPVESVEVIKYMSSVFQHQKDKRGDTFSKRDNSLNRRSITVMAIVIFDKIIEEEKQKLISCF